MTYVFSKIYMPAYYQHGNTIDLHQTFLGVVYYFEGFVMIKSLCDWTLNS